MIWKKHRWITNAQVGKLTSVKLGLFNDSPNPALTYWGIGGVGALVLGWLQ